MFTNFVGGLGGPCGPFRSWRSLRHWGRVPRFHGWSGSLIGALVPHLSALTPVLARAADRETDARARGDAEGALAANTCKDGLLGNMYRATYATTGTYAGNTNVRIDLMTDGLTASP